ncbi:hypothetical protein [Myxococcus vastator]|uniref:hypothetical protein n=1 Tax=Myxococcus vastator TaxID=2709664 RepID=UPI0013D53F9C|nr:hypothetical protein [Myxococcus vastator]
MSETTQGGMVKHAGASEGARPDAALARLRALETLESGYEAWLELQVEHAASRLRFREERERLEQQGSFLLGAVRAAALTPPPGAEPALVTPPAAPGDFLRDAEDKLTQARDALALREAESEAKHAEAFAEIRATLKDRIQRYLSASRPSLTLLLRRVGTERAILHLKRVSGDTPVLLCFLLTGRIPSRYGFLLDDSTEDVSLPPAPLYADEGVAAEQVRPDAAGLEARVRGAGEVVPLKGFLPLFVPRPAGGEDFFRLLQRGVVLEVEVSDGTAFRNVLSREESERFAGHLLRLKLEGRIGLDIEVG